MRLLKSEPIPQTVTLAFAGGGQVLVKVRASSRARAYRLSITARGGPVLTVPQGGRWSEARAFLERHTGWLETRLEHSPAPTPLAPGAMVPLRDVPHRLAALGGVRGTVLVRQADGEGGEPEIAVPGEPAHFERKLVDFFKREARADLEAACARHATTLDVRVAAIRLRDQATRWGSCSAARTLNFNWRLVLAPPHVLDYVAAHEVAHIREMNHAPAFWRTVGLALPDYERGRRWLKAHGQDLMRIGSHPA